MKVCLKTMNKVAQDDLFIQTETFIKEIGSMENRMDLEFMCIIRMGQCMKVNGEMIFKKE